MKATDKRPLGRTKLQVTVLGLGTATLGNLYAPVSDADAHDTVKTAFDAGVRFVDTAPFYGHGWSEHRVGEALRGYKRDDIVLSTKIGRLLKPKDPAKGIDGGVFAAVLPFEPVFDYSYDGVMRSVEDSLQRLGTHRIDVLLIHDVDRWTHGSQEASDRRMKEVLEGGYKAMVKLRESGAVGAIGAGLNEWDTSQKLAEASDLDCFLLAGRYSLLEQESLKTFLPLCQKRGIGIFLGGPYNTGILATGAVPGAMYNYAPAKPDILERVRKLEAVCQRHKVTLASAALQFPLAHPAVCSVIPGAKTAAEVKRNIATIEAPIGRDFWQELKRERLIAEEAPLPA
ncbi:MAG TPA: aldo/keto reductase [Candidatus Acidoferrum sp.]|nr:aldo/keto reductase [Candidatus Acidoferrum sp.]